MTSIMADIFLWIIHAYLSTLKLSTVVTDVTF